MRICFFSDVHGNIDALEAFFEDIREKEKIDFMVFGGDIFGYFYKAEEVITKLRQNNVYCLLGNHDQMFLDLLENKLERQYLCEKYGSAYQAVENKISNDNVMFIQSLSARYDLEVDNLKIAFVHGSIEDPLNGRIYPDTEIRKEHYCGFDFVFMGHTHHKMQREIGKCVLINPGSVGQPRDGKGTSYVIFDTHSKKCEFCVFQYDSSSLLQDIEKQDGKNEFMAKKLKELVTRVR